MRIGVECLKIWRDWDEKKALVDFSLFPSHSWLQKFAPKVRNSTLNYQWVSHIRTEGQLWFYSWKQYRIKLKTQPLTVSFSLNDYSHKVTETGAQIPLLMWVAHLITHPSLFSLSYPIAKGPESFSKVNVMGLNHLHSHHIAERFTRT